MAHSNHPETASPAKPQARTAPLGARFRRDESGATAVEFGMIAIPFLTLIFAIMETAMMFWTSQVLEDAVTQTSRRLLTGESHAQYANASTATADFKRDLCANATILVDCDKVTIDVRSYASFAGAGSGTAASNPVNNGALSTAGFGYNQPQPAQIVVVRAVLEYPIMLTGWNSALVTLGTDRRAIIASTTFRTEPYVVTAQ